MNNPPRYVDNVYIYLHGDQDWLSFYYAQYYDAEDIKEKINPVHATGKIFLFSCKGGRGDLASAMAAATGCTVIACVYKVSFENGCARYGIENYIRDGNQYGECGWYSFPPNGEKKVYSEKYILIDWRGGY